MEAAAKGRASQRASSCESRVEKEILCRAGSSLPLEGERVKLRGKSRKREGKGWRNWRGECGWNGKRGRRERNREGK